MFNVFDDNITPLLSIAENEDLQPLVDYILKANLTESITSDEDYKKYNPDHTKYISLIESEIKRFGGNSFINLLRRGGPDYYSIVCDVADRLGARYEKQAPISDIELSIILNVLGTAWQKMSKEEKKEFINDIGVSSSILKNLPSSLPVAAVQAAVASSGLAAYMVTLTVANAVANTLLGRGLTIAASSTVARAATICRSNWLGNHRYLDALRPSWSSISRHHSLCDSNSAPASEISYRALQELLCAHHE